MITDDELETLEIELNKACDGLSVQHPVCMEATRDLLLIEVLRGIRALAPKPKKAKKVVAKKRVKR